MAPVLIQFDTSGGAFAEGGSFEVAELLGKITRAVADGDTSGIVRDSWGNKCGQWSATIDNNADAED